MNIKLIREAPVEDKIKLTRVYQLQSESLEAVDSEAVIAQTAPPQRSGNDPIAFQGMSNLSVGLCALILAEIIFGIFMILN